MTTFPVASHAWKVALAAVIAGGSSGCSLAFVNGPPPNHEKIPYFDCSSSNALPTIDLLFAGAAAVDAIGGAAGAGSLSSSRVDLISVGVEAAAFAASAIYGYGKTADCRKAQADMLRRASLTPTFASPPGFAGPYPPGFVLPAPVPYDPWVAPSPPPAAPPPVLSPLGPLPAVPAPGPAPATDGETPRSGKDVQ